MTSAGACAVGSPAIADAHARHKPISQEDLAGLLGISRRTIGRVLTIEDVKADVSAVVNINETAARSKAN